MLVSVFQKAFFVILFCFCLLGAQAIDEVRLNNESVRNISESVYLLEDSSGSYSFSEIYNKPLKFQFTKSENRNVVYIPFGHNVFWLRFTLINATDTELDYLLELKNATIDAQQTYIVSDSLVRISKVSGDVITIDPRDIFSVHNIVPLKLEPRVKYDVYIRINTGGDALNLPITCEKYERLFFRSNKQNLLIGLFAGLIVTLAIVSFLSVFIQNGGAIFSYFALYALFNGVWLLYMEGVAYQYLLPSNAEINNLFITLLPLCACFFYVLFALLYLQIKQFYPRIYKIVLWFNWFVMLYVAFLIVNQLVWHLFDFRILEYVYAIQITLANLMLIMLVLSILSILILRKNKRAAILFLAAVIPLIISVNLFNLNNFAQDIDITTRNNFTKASLSWQILVLFLAMFDQIRRTQDYSNRQIEENRKKYFDILENSTEAIFVIKDGLIQFSNSQLSVFLRVMADDLIKLPVALIAHTEDRDRLLSYLSERVLDDSEEQHIIFKTNETYNVNSWMELNAIPIEWEGRHAMLCLMNDVSQRVLNEEERKRLENQLFQSQKLETVGTLAGGVAHEINNILTPILGYSEMVLDGMDNENEFRSDVEAINHSAQRAKDVVKQILSFSRQIDVNREEIAVLKVIEMVRTMLQASINSSITLEYEILAPEALLNVNVTQIEQVILNLCNNASHAIKHNNGVIRIGVELADGTKEENKSILKPINYVCISVKDNGSGMSEDTIKRIFEPFFTTKKVGEGTGLGLSVVHGIVKNHGGVIHVSSSYGIGTRFDIYLPLHYHKDDALNELKSVPIAMYGTESILVIDDESEITNIIKRALSHLGYQVTTFSNSPDALREIERNPAKYQLIISDLKMPRISGRELMNSAQQINSSLRFVILTGMFEQQIDHRLFPEAICRIITKPVNIKELSMFVRQLLDS